MPFQKRWSWVMMGLALACSVTSTARAVIIYGGPDGRVTTAPPTIIANSTWDNEGSWGAGAGTAIAPNYFITARHLGGGVGDKFSVGGIDYTTTAMYDGPGNSDIRIVQVAQTFNSYAQVYNGTNDATGDPLMLVFGRGTARGADVVGPNGNQGYLWGASDGAMSWGMNRVTFTTMLPNGPGGDFLGFEFRPGGWPGVDNPATLSAGDSGGGLFIQDTDGVWKLAGVNFAVDGDFSRQQDTGYFQAAMYDARDFYVGSPSDNFFVDHPDPDEAVWQAAYASRLSTQWDFIQSVISVPEPSALVLTSLGLSCVCVVLARKRLTGGVDSAG